MTIRKKGSITEIWRLLAFCLCCLAFPPQAVFAETPQEPQPIVIYPSAFGILPALDTFEPSVPSQEPFREIGILWGDRYIGGTTGTLAQQSQEPFFPPLPEDAVYFEIGRLLVKFVPGVLPNDPRLFNLMATFDADFVYTLWPMNMHLFNLNTVKTLQETFQAVEEFQKHELVEHAEPYGISYIPPSLFTAFWDVPYIHWAYDFIHRIYFAGVTSGCSLEEYCPDDPVTRGQMAVFLVTALGQSPAPCTGRFRDVPIGHPFCGFVERMFDIGGITAGCGFGGLTFCVDEPVTRAQMAVFIETALGNSPNSCLGRFADADGIALGATFCGFIERLAQDNITAGCTATTFCPLNAVTRAEMAVFLSTAFLNQAVFQTSLVLKDAAGAIKNEFSAGEAITFELTISNLTNVTQILTLPHSQTYDFLVGSDAGILWNWSHDKGFLAFISQLIFAPLETKTFTEVWNQGDNGGVQIQARVYHAQGFVTIGQETVNLVLSPESPTRSPITTFTVK
jgi:hypothetical protein